MRSLLIRALAVGVLLVSCLICSAPVVAAENPFIRDIQARGVLRVGLPDLNTPPAYYLDESSGELQGYDIEIARGLARELDVDVYFDRTSESLNQLVARVGQGDFDLAIGKLGLTYKRMFDAFPVQYLRFRHALLANRSFLASLSSEPGTPDFAKELKASSIRIGSISRTIWETETANNFPNATFVGYKTWPDCQKALFDGDVDAIYRDMTEIKPLVYATPQLILDYVPILFDDIIDKKSIYLSEEGSVGFSEFIRFFISKEWGDIKTDSDILEEFKSTFVESKA